MHENGEKIAVKLLHNNMQVIDDTLFKQEFTNLMKLNHENVIRLVGYCYQTQHQHMEFQGKIIFGEMIYKALCFEYMHKGSLQKHLYGMRLLHLDYVTHLVCEKKRCTFEFLWHTCTYLTFTEESQGLDWDKRYKIIKGTCEGLKYLHEGFKETIYHLDLKPENILLDEYMMPKLADFGLSKLFGEEQTRVTTSPLGTM